MSRLWLVIVSLTWVSGLLAERPRLLVLTDLSNEPDDEESLVRLLVYSNEFDLEGLIASTSTHLRKGPREDLLHKAIDAYGQVLPNLSLHAKGYPSVEHLHSICRTGQTTYGMNAVGEGKTTPGSQLLLEAAEKKDSRPLWVTVWGGANTLAQTLTDAQRTRSPEQVAALVKQMRVYTISDQDDAGHWIRPTFPTLTYLCCPGAVSGSYWQSTWSGISGDRHYQHGVMHHFGLVDNPWLKANIAEGHGPLGALYPPVEYIMEGDTPSWLGLIDHGLGWSESPSYGGWGGRYVEHQPWGESRKLWTGIAEAARDTVKSDDTGQSETSNQATIWRWRQHYQHDFAARMDWCVAESFDSANHNPVPVLNGDASKQVIALEGKSGETLSLDATGSSDPDGDALSYRWWIYGEAGTVWDKRHKRLPDGVALTQSTGLKTQLKLPPVDAAQTLHIILEAQDDGTPSLWGYRRAVITVRP
jgi:Protein of unknown function (DUF1593)